MIETIALVATLTAAPVQLDLDALKDGQLPAAGTIEEADACAVQAEYLVLAALNAGDLEAAAGRVRAMLDWLKRASALRPMTIQDYGRDPAYIDAVHALDAIDPPGHAALDAACAQRLKTRAW